MHSILSRQIEKYLGNADKVPKEWQEFVSAVNDAYSHFDEDRSLIERSMELSSKEFTDVNKKLQNELDKGKERRDELERLNKIMIGRELKMMELKEKIKQLQFELEDAKTNKSFSTSQKAKNLIIN